jgi:hypothetical protein
MALPFLNWLVDIMPEAPFEMPLRVVSRHAQKPGYSACASRRRPRRGAAILSHRSTRG